MPTRDEMTTDERRKYVNQQVAPQTFDPFTQWAEFRT